jgi:carbon storage regulator
MLVLSRKPNERIVIADDIEIVVIAVQGDRVKLGFTAPDRVRIQRAEILQRIRAAVLSPTRPGRLSRVVE